VRLYEFLNWETFDNGQIVRISLDCPEHAPPVVLSVKAKVRADS
jgi:hypothetical protein